MEKRNIALLVLLVLAIFTRFFGIEFQSLWIDEGATFYYSHYTWEQFTTAYEPNSPIYYMMEGLALDILGHSEFALRFTSAVAGVAVVIVAFFVAEKMFNNWRFATIVSMLFLTSIVCIKYSQEARGFEIVLMLFLIQVYLLLCAIEEEKYIHWILLAIVSAISITMQYTSILATATLFLYAFYHYRDEIKNKKFVETRKILISGIIFVILTIPLWKFMIEALTFHNDRIFKDSMAHGLLYTIETVKKLLCGNEYWGIAVLLFVLGINGAIYCYKTHKEKFLLLMWIIVFPLLITTIISFTKNLSPRYILWSVTGYLIFVALSFYSIGERTKSLFNKKINMTQALTILTVVLICCTSLPHYYTAQHKDDYRGAGECLNQYAESGDILIYRGSENLEYAALSFYFMPSEHGVEHEKYKSIKQIVDLSREGTYGKIFVLTKAESYEYNYLSKLDPSICKKIFSAKFDIELFMIIGEIIT